MTPSKPYLMRALYEWIVDNECTPYMLVDTTSPGVRVPDGFADEGQMVLNLSPAATRHLIMNNETVSFEARFSGMPHQLLIPVGAVLAVYAQENGQGMFFEPELPADDEQHEGVQEPEEDPTPDPPRPPGGRPGLRLVK